MTKAKKAVKTSVQERVSPKLLKFVKGKSADGESFNATLTRILPGFQKKAKAKGGKKNVKRAKSRSKKTARASRKR